MLLSSNEQLSHFFAPICLTNTSDFIACMQTPTNMAYHIIAGEPSYG